MFFNVYHGITLKKLIIQNSEKSDYLTVTPVTYRV